MEILVLPFPCTAERKVTLNAIIKPLQLISSFINYFQLLFQACIPCSLFKKWTSTLHKTFKNRKIRKSYIQSIQSPLLFFFLLWLLPTFFLEEDEQDSRKLEEVVKDKRVEMHRTREKNEDDKMSVWDAEDWKKDYHNKIFQKAANKVHFSNTQKYSSSCVNFFNFCMQCYLKIKSV